MTSSEVTDSASGAQSRPRSSDIFISYAREDMRFAQELARELEDRGYSVWWDFRLLAGTNYRAEIAARIGKARKVLVVWSPTSIASPFVLDEANRALQQNKLVPLSIAGAEPPLGFGQTHTLSIRSLSSDLEKIVAAIEGVAATSKVGRRRRKWIRPRLIAAMVVLALAAGAFALLDRFQIDRLVNCVKYGCELDYVTYRSRMMGLEFVYPQSHLTLDTTQEARRRLPLLNRKGEVEAVISRSPLPPHKDPVQGSKDEQQALIKAGNRITYIGPQVEPAKKDFYALSGLQPDGKIFYVRRWYTKWDVVSAEFVFPQESKSLYDRIIIDMTIRGFKIGEPK
jgi:TIR domain-containing protein